MIGISKGTTLSSTVHWLFRLTAHFGCIDGLSRSMYSKVSYRAGLKGATFSVWQFGETTLTLRAAADADLGDADIVIAATSGSIRGSQKLHVHIID